MSCADNFMNISKCSSFLSELLPSLSSDVVSDFCWLKVCRQHSLADKCALTSTFFLFSVLNYHFDCSSISSTASVRKDVLSAYICLDLYTTIRGNSSPIANPLCMSDVPHIYVLSDLSTAVISYI